VNEVTDARAMTQAEREAVWVPVARELLIDTARTYGAWITYEEIAERVQEATGVRSRVPFRHWIGRLLGAVSDSAVSRGEPHLTALCVHTGDQTIGVGYPWAPADASEAEREDAASRDRLECYRRYAADLPADGGVPAFTPKVRERLDRKAKASESARAVCSVCGIELPATGICESH
jgi:hypothetical protein